MIPLCFNESCTKDFLDLKNDIIYASKAGFEEIEIRFDCLEVFLKGHNLNDLKNLLINNNLKPNALNAFYIYPEFLEEDESSKRKAQLLLKLKLIDELYELVGINKCIVVAPLLKDETEALTYNLDLTKNDIREILSYLCKSLPHIKWIFEPVGLSRSLVKDADFAYEIIKDLHHDNLGLVLDAYNLYLKDRCDKYNFDSIPSDKIFLVHMTNGLKVPEGTEITDQRYRRFCTDGTAINMLSFLKALSRRNYGGAFSEENFDPNLSKQYTQNEIIDLAKKDLNLMRKTYKKIRLFAKSVESLERI